MQEFIFRLPTRIMFGAGVVKNIDEVCKNLKATKVFLVTGQTSTKNSPHLPVIIASLEQAGIAVKLFSEIEADPSVETVDKGVAELKAFGADVVVAFGGGSPMDAAKSMAMLSTNEGSIGEYIRSKRTIISRGIPLVSIPTTAGTGSEVTAAAVTTDKATQEKLGLSHDYLIPVVAMVDPQLHISMPPSVTAATGIDALTHAIEAYIAMKATPLSDALAIHSIKMIGANLRRAYANGSDLETRGNMAIASLIAGGSFTNAGLGAVHAIAHPVGAQFGVPHGVANGVMLPYVMEYCLIANYPKFRDIAVALGEDVSGMSEKDAAVHAVKAVRSLNKDIGIPGSLLDTGVTADAAEAIVKDAATYRLLPNSPRQLTAKDLHIIVERALKR
jgi:alcohol dehydrogenase class IV